MSTSNIRKEKRKALQVRPVVAEIVVTAVFDIPKHITDEQLRNDYSVTMSGNFNNINSHLVLLEQDYKDVHLSRKLMVSNLLIEDTYVK